MLGSKLEVFKDILPSFLKMSLKEDQIGEPNIPEFIEADKGHVSHGGVQNFLINFDSIEFQNITQLIHQYNQFALLDFVEEAVDEIVDEAIVMDDFNTVVNLNLDLCTFSESVKKKIIDEFDYLKNLLKLDTKADEYFRRWYIQGRYYIQPLYGKSPKDGIVGFHHLSPYKIFRFYDEKSNKYWYYINQIEEEWAKKRFFKPDDIPKEYLVSSDHIIFVPSGLTDAKNKYYISHLHKAIKPANQLKLMEDSMVVYRFCLVGDTRIRTPEGYQYIKDLNSDDKVYSYDHDGSTKLTKVLHLINNGVKKVYKVTSKHNEIIATGTHPILVKRGNNIEYVDVKDLIIGKDKLINVTRDEEIPVEIPYIFEEEEQWAKLSDDGVNHFKNNEYENISSLIRECGGEPGRVKQFLYASGRSKALPFDQAREICQKFNIPESFLIVQDKHEIHSERRKDAPKFVDEKFARLFGFLIGDGSVRKQGISFAAGTNAKQNEYYAKILEDYFGKVHFYQESRSDNMNLGSYVVYSQKVSKIFFEMGYISGAHNKRIPQWVFTASKSIRRAFIEGLCDADGAERFTPKGTRFTTIEMCNKKLIEDIKEVWSSIGLCSGKLSSRKRSGGHEIEPGRLMLPTTSYIVTLVDLELPKYENVLSVVDVGEEEVFDITVENELHNFIANGVPVHNTRSPERRAFYIDVGKLGQTKADQYVKSLMNKFKTRLNYDTSTGLINQSKSIMTMLEDYWLPRMGTKGTEVQTLQGGQQLGEITDVLYFKRRTWKALKLPSSRADNDNAPSVDFGSSEFSREELKFARFCRKLRSKFAEIFTQSLKIHLVRKGIVTMQEWQEELEDKIRYLWNENSYWAESKELSLLERRVDMLEKIKEHRKYFSEEYINKNILRRTDDEIELVNKQIEEDLKNNPPVESETPENFADEGQ
jgi:intein/homing endonuclease